MLHANGMPLTIKNQNSIKRSNGAYRSYKYISKSIGQCLWSYNYTNMMWERIIHILMASDMWHGRLDFIWSCYMVVSTKEDMDVWSIGLLLSPHNAQNPLEMDNNWMYANLGIMTYTKKHCQLWHQSICGTFGNTCLKWYSRETHTIVDAITTIWIDLVVSLHVQFENLQGDSKSQELA